MLAFLIDGLQQLPSSFGEGEESCVQAAGAYGCDVVGSIKRNSRVFAHAFGRCFAEADCQPLEPPGEVAADMRLQSAEADPIKHSGAIRKPEVRLDSSAIRSARYATLSNRQSPKPRAS